MLYLIDSARLSEIERLIKYYPIDGVTTNPSIVSREHDTDFLGLLRKIRDIIGLDRALHVQVTSKEAEQILKEAEKLHEKISGRLVIKVPVTPEGLRAIRLLKMRGITVTATAVFTPMQALLAAKSGADYVAPYVNRLDNISADGPSFVAEIAKVLEQNHLETKILAASFKNVEQIHRSILAGAQCVTLSPDLFDRLAVNPLTSDAITVFDRDWKNVYGDSTLLDLLNADE